MIYKNILQKITFIYVILLTLSGFSEGTISPVQSLDRPMDLDIVSPVYQYASDERSTDFYNNYLPEVLDIVNQNLAENISLTSETVSSLSVDPSKLTFTQDYDARVYFVKDGAGYHNSLGFNPDGVGVDEGTPQLVFPDASYHRKLQYWNEEQPLRIGDYVELGTISAGTTLDFFVIPDGADGGTNRGFTPFTTVTEMNPDGIQHAISFAIEDSPYIIMGFEDIYNGGDQDYNDLLFVVDIGQNAVQNVIDNSALVPEPEEILILIIFAMFLIKYLKDNQFSLNLS